MSVDYYGYSPAAWESLILLGAISTRVHGEGKPLITALVIYKGANEPGDGFFSIAQRLGRLPSGPLSRSVKDDFWMREVARSHEAFP